MLISPATWSPRCISRVLGEALTLVLAGMVPGVAGGIVLSRLATQRIAGLLPGVDAMDPMALAAAAAMLLTVAGIAWLQPASAPLAVIAAAICIGLPLVFQPIMAERDLRLRSHAGALGRFYLDALLGLLPIRVHGAQPAMQRQQDTLLVQWARAGHRFFAASTVVEGALAPERLGKPGQEERERLPLRTGHGRGRMVHLSCHRSWKPWT